MCYAALAGCPARARPHPPSAPPGRAGCTSGPRARDRGGPAVPPGQRPDANQFGAQLEAACPGTPVRFPSGSNLDGGALGVEGPGAQGGTSPAPIRARRADPDPVRPSHRAESSAQSSGVGDPPPLGPGMAGRPDRVRTSHAGPDRRWTTSRRHRRAAPVDAGTARTRPRTSRSVGGRRSWCWPAFRGPGGAGGARGRRLAGRRPNRTVRDRDDGAGPTHVRHSRGRSVTVQYSADVRRGALDEGAHRTRPAPRGRLAQVGRAASRSRVQAGLAGAAGGARPHAPACQQGRHQRGRPQNADPVPRRRVRGRGHRWLSTP